MLEEKRNIKKATKKDMEIIQFCSPYGKEPRRRSLHLPTQCHGTYT